MPTSVETFYRDRGGGKLIVPDNYPPEINEYLKEEAKLIRNVITRDHYNAFFEVGCMDARNFPLAAGLGIPYVGIDIVDPYIKAARKKIRQTRKDFPAVPTKVTRMSINHLDSKVIDFLYGLPGAKPLAVFPFNSFGNIDKPEEAIASVSDASIDPLILTYQTTNDATAIRRTYYQNCGYTDLRSTVTPEGVRFRSSDGLNTLAPNAFWMETVLDRHGFDTHTYDFGRMGRAYHGVKRNT